MSNINVEEKIEGFNLTNFNLNENDITGFLYSRNFDREKELRSEINSLRAEFQKQSETLQTTREEIESLQVQLEKSQEQVAALNSEIEVSEARLKQQSDVFEDEKKSWLAEVNKLNEERAQDANVLKTTSKLNLKLQADLDNIRVQYSEKVQSEKELTNLINELYVKLKQASEFYYKLEENYPEIARKFDE